MDLTPDPKLTDLAEWAEGLLDALIMAGHSREDLAAAFIAAGAGLIAKVDGSLAAARRLQFTARTMYAASEIDRELGEKRDRERPN